LESVDGREMIVLGVLREATTVPLDVQRREIEDYVASRGLGRVEWLVFRQHRLIWHAVDLYNAVKSVGASIVVAYSWRILASRSCGRLYDIMNAAFAGGANEVHVVSGDVVSRSEWDKHRGFLARFANTRYKLDRELARKADEFVPLTRDESRKIYNELARVEGKAKVAHWDTVVKDLAAEALREALEKGIEPGVPARSITDELKKLDRARRRRRP